MLVINYFSFFWGVKPLFLSVFHHNVLEWIIHGSCMLNVYLKPLFLAHENNILIYSQMRIQLYQAHIMTDIGRKSGKKSINWGSVGI